MLPERVHLSHETGNESLNVAQKNLSSEKVKQNAEKAARKVRPWVGWVARTGYVAKGVIYATIGLLAMQEARGSRNGRQATRTKRGYAQYRVAALRKEYVGPLGLRP